LPCPNLFYDHDTIRVGAGAGLYTDVRLKVAGNAVFTSPFPTARPTMCRCASPSFPEAPVASSLCRGGVRHIRRVDFTYTKLPGGGTAVVTLQGRKL
jgi:hypothetical protein